VYFLTTFLGVLRVLFAYAASGAGFCKLLTNSAEVPQKLRFITCQS